MTTEEYTQAALDWLAAHGVDLTADNYRWYGPYCAAVDHYTDGKLTVAEIMTATDKLSDLLTVGLRGFYAGPLPKADRIPGQMRAMEVIEETKGRLGDLEKYLFAICVFHATCIRVYDEESGKVKSGIHDFKDFETFDRLLMRDYLRRIPLSEILGSQSPVKESSNFGYTPEEAIGCRSVPESYAYLNCLHRADGTPHTMQRLGSMHHNGGILDIWEATYGAESCRLYINAYAMRPTFKAPSGWVIR